MTAEKTIAFTRWTFVSKAMSLLFNMLSRLVITFLQRSKHLLLMAAVTICSGFGDQENKVSHCFHCVLIYLPWSNGTRCHDLCFLTVEFYANFFTLLFHFYQVKKVSSSSLSSLRVLSSAYLRLLIFLLAILIQAWAPSSLVFHMIYSAYKLNKEGDNMQPWYTPFQFLTSL